MGKLTDGTRSNLQAHRALGGKLRQRGDPARGNAHLQAKEFRRKVGWS